MRHVSRIDFNRVWVLDRSGVNERRQRHVQGSVIKIWPFQNRSGGAFVTRSKVERRVSSVRIGNRGRRRWKRIRTGKRGRQVDCLTLIVTKKLLCHCEINYLANNKDSFTTHIKQPTCFERKGRSKMCE